MVGWQTAKHRETAHSYTGANEHASKVSFLLCIYICTFLYLCYASDNAQASKVAFLILKSLGACAI